MMDEEKRLDSAASNQKKPVKTVVPKKPIVQPNPQIPKKVQHYTYKGGSKLLVSVVVFGILLAGGGGYIGYTNLQTIFEMQRNQTALQENFLMEVVTKENYTLELRKKILEKEAEVQIMQKGNITNFRKNVRDNFQQSSDNDYQMRRSLGRVVKSCHDLYPKLGINRSGLYYITIVRNITKPVYCDLETDGGGWTVIQRRKSDMTIFSRYIEQYASGFGHAPKEYFLGLEPIRELTSRRNYTLRIDLENFDGETAYAQYSSFFIGNNDTMWKLNVSGYNGTAGDSLSASNGSPFATVDNDDAFQCALNRFGGWWFTPTCGDSNLNGRYINPEGKPTYRTIFWESWSKDVPLKKTEMKIRPA